MIGALLDHLWQSTLFCAAVWLITLTLRHNGAAIRHQLWMLASLKFLVPFSALYTVGVEAGLPSPVESQPTFLNVAMEAASPVMSPVITLRAATEDAATLAFAVVAAWIAGAAFLALRWLRGWHAANSLTRATRPAPDSSPDVRVTDADVEPSVARVFHPVVLLPAALLRRLTATQLHAVLAHEHEHIARNDNFKAHVHRLVETLFWFHPLVWWIGRRLLEERERACDEAVLERGHDPGEYAAGILAVCRHCRGSRLAGTQTGQAMSALSGDLTSRIRNILHAAPPAAIGIIKSVGLTACVAFALSVPLFAGVVDGGVHRREVIIRNARLLDDAVVHVSASTAPYRRGSFGAEANVVNVRNSSLRELVALAYDVRPAQVTGGGEWLDEHRYDIRAVVPGVVNEPEKFDPLAMRGLVSKLLASRFDLEIQVHSRKIDQR
jgi:beta-lactamase regulating signal transducer with metallopeptidase domain